MGYLWDIYGISMGHQRHREDIVRKKSRRTNLKPQPQNLKTYEVLLSVFVGVLPGTYEKRRNAFVDFVPKYMTKKSNKEKMDLY